MHTDTLSSSKERRGRSFRVPNKVLVTTGLIATAAIAAAPYATTSEARSDVMIVRVGAHELQGSKPRPKTDTGTYAEWLDIRCSDQACVDDMLDKYVTARYLKTIQE